MAKTKVTLKICRGPPKKSKKNNAAGVEEVRTGTQEKKLAKKADKKERAKYARASNVLNSSKPKSLIRLTPADHVELERVKAHDDVNLIIKTGSIIGVFHRGRWALGRARRVAKARGTRVSVHHQAAKSGTAPQPAGPAGATTEAAAASEDAATPAALEPTDKTDKEKHASDVRDWRAKQNGTNENNVLTYKGEALVDVIRTDELDVDDDGDDVEDAEADDDDDDADDDEADDDDVDIEVEEEGDHIEDADDAADADNIEGAKTAKGLYVRGERFQRRLIASEDAVRKYSTMYEDLTAFDANPKRKLRDVANLLARKESQDEGFVVGTLVEELRPGEIKNGTEAAAATATHALPVQ